MKIFHSNNVVLSLIASELKLVLILHSINSKIISDEIKGKPRALFCCNDSRLPKKIDHIIVRFLAKFASITCDSFNGR